MSEPLPPSLPPVIGTPPPSLGAPGSPPPVHKASLAKQLLAILLSLCLGLFLAEAVVSLLDDSLKLIFGVHFLTAFRGMAGFFALLIALVVYGMMGITPMVPKRLFLPITLFNPLAMLAAIPLMIYFYNRFQQITWVISLGQVILGLWILRQAQGALKFRWPPVAENQLAARRFSWRNLLVFLLVNVVVLLPGVVVYLLLCTSVAVNHFTEGFVALRPGGLTVQARSYVRHDGKMIKLIPMAHVGDAAFYRTISQSFPTNSTILMEGVTDNQNLLTNRITYKRMAASLGVTEQVKEFKPRQGEMVHADVDVEEFSPHTIGLINLVMLIHAKGAEAETILKLLQFSPPPDAEEAFWDDLLGKRNRHLVAEIEARLSETENIIVPWGAAHMPEVARAIQKSGFRLDETREYTVIRFGAGGNKSDAASKGGVLEKPKRLERDLESSR